MKRIAKEVVNPFFELFGAHPAIRYIFFEEISKKDAASIRAKTKSKNRNSQQRKTSKVLETFEV